MQWVELKTVKPGIVGLNPMACDIISDSVIKQHVNDSKHLKKIQKENNLFIILIERQLEQQHTCILNMGQIIEKLNLYNFPQKYHPQAVLEQFTKGTIYPFVLCVLLINRFGTCLLSLSISQQWKEFDL